MTEKSTFLPHGDASVALSALMKGYLSTDQHIFGFHTNQDFDSINL